ncbi:MAG: glycosyltransferase family 4 protein [Patescibacteria group bacterium]
MNKSKKLTIYYLSPMFKPFIGGAEISLERLLVGLKKEGKVNHFLITSLIDEVGNLVAGEDEISEDTVRVGFSKNTPITDSSNWKRAMAEKLVQRLIDHSSEIDLIYLNSHIFFQFPDLIGKILSLKKPVILKIIYTKALSVLEPCKEFLLTSSAKKYLSIHCVSKNIQKQVLEFGFLKKQLFFCPNAIDLDQFRARRAEDRLFLKNRFNVSEDDILFIFSGRFSPQKNIDKIVEMFETLERRKEKIKLFMVGYVSHTKTAELVERLKKQSKNIFWVDRVENKEMANYLRAADCFVMASRDEGMSNSLIEAMASGLCPIVPEQISGMGDLVQHSVSGVLYDLSNKNALIQDLEKIDRDRALSLGRKARQNIAELCGIDRVASTHSSFYKSKLGKNKAVFCIVAHNEEDNICALVDKIKNEPFPDNSS